MGVWGKGKGRCRGIDISKQEDNTMRVELITTGEELLDGRVINTNIQTIASSLHSIGIALDRAVTVGDDSNALAQVFEQSINEADILFITGGLGPTHDDRTVEVLATVIGLPLEQRQDVIDMMMQNIPVPEKTLNKANLKQAQCPKGALVMINEIGTAPGLIISCGNCTLFVLPGVPRELIAIMDKHVIPYIKRLFPDLKPGLQVIIKTFGIRESEISERLELLFPLPRDITLGFQVNYPEIHLILKLSEHIKKSEKSRGAGRAGSRVKSLASTKAQFKTVKEKICSCLDRYVFGFDHDTFAGVIRKICVENGVTLALAESCTGGLISQILTKEPGTSDYFLLSAVTYANQAKQSVLGVSELAIKHYGAVSEQTAREMVVNVQKISGSDTAISVTGIAGPTGGTKAKPVGAVFIGTMINGIVDVKRYVFQGDRNTIQLRAAYQALDDLRKLL
ncbi:CinA family nicotinamide mononucleotide deamidase-related protein [Thermoproteota archaeon]